jgi:hypothetical protein
MTANETLSIAIDDAKVRAAFARLKKIGTDASPMFAEIAEVSPRTRG